MNYEKWKEKYKPNMTKQDQMILYETFGNDLEKIRKTDPNYVWTVVDTNDESLAILPGIHHVNRVSFVITKISHKQKDSDMEVSA